MPSNTKPSFERKFKLRIGPLTTQAPLQKGEPLAFINVDNPEQMKDRTNQHKIRRHVMKSIGQSRRKYHTSMVLQPTSMLVPLSVPAYWGEVNICDNFRRLFCAMDMVSQGLLSLALDDTAYEFQRRLHFGLHNAQRRHKELDEAQSLHELKQYTDSLSLVRKSFVTPNSLVSRHAIVGTIICLAYFDMRIRNHARWKMHMQGLQNVVKTYGGIDALDAHQALRQALFLADVLGSLVQDVQPWFPRPHDASIPVYVAPKSSARETAGSSGRLDAAAMPNETPSVIIDDALGSASQLAALLQHVQQCTADQMSLQLLIPVCGIAHDILSIPRWNYDSHDVQKPCSTARYTPMSAAAELVRLSALAFVCTVITTTSGDDLFCATHRRGFESILLTHAEDGGWDEIEHLELWVLVIQITMEAGPTRRWFLERIMKVMDSLFLRSWEELLSCLHQVTWVDQAAMPQMALLKSDIQEHLPTRACA